MPPKPGIAATKGPGRSGARAQKPAAALLKNGINAGISGVLGQKAGLPPVAFPLKTDLVKATGIDLSDGLGVDDLAAGAKKLRDNSIWRWATIGISCAGGLASGWLGSGISDQAGSFFSASSTAIIGSAPKTLTDRKPPVGLEMTAGVLPLNLTGKADRATPHDENLCTVLELDRGTGLTLAKPCKLIETAEFNSTLGKADLLARPQ